MSKKKFAFFILTAVIAINFAFGFPRLAQYSAVDEPYWTYGRISKFWSGIENRKWSRTNINDKPGVTTAIIAGAGLLKVDPMPYETLRQKLKTDAELAYMRDINFFLRLPIYLMALVFIGLFYFFVRKLFGEETALISTVIIGLSPIILGISLIINPDSLLWGFLPLSVLSYLIYLKDDSRKFLIISGILLGLSLLTKYVSNILYVFFFGLIFLDYLFSAKTEIFEYLKKKFRDFAILLATSFTVFFVFFPAAWRKPIMVLEGTFLSVVFQTTWPIFAAALIAILFDFFALKGKFTGKILNFLSRYKFTFVWICSLAMLAIIAFALINVYGGMKFFDFEAFLASPKSGEDTPFIFANFLGNSFSGVYALLFGLTPLVALAFIGFWLSAVKEKTIAREKTFAFYLAVFVFAYFLAAAANKLGATVRYQIVNYPIAGIVAAFFLAELADKLLKNNLKIKLAALLIFIGLSVASLIAVKPFYFAYSSGLLPEDYMINSKDMGDGSFEAAEYLNRMPNARELVIWTDKGAVCESFVGRCYIGFDFKEWKTVKFDYFVASSGRKVRSIKMSGPFDRFADFEKLYSADFYDHKVEIDGRKNNFVKIINGQKVYREN